MRFLQKQNASTSLTPWHLAVVTAISFSGAAQADEFVSTGFLPGSSYSTNAGISSDGTTVVGTSTSGGSDNATLWTKGGGLISLGSLSGDTYSVGFAVSSNGLAAAGYSGNNVNEEQAFRWTPGGMVGLGHLNSDPYSEAYGISSDGTTVVGTSFPIAFANGQAFRWTQATGMVGLGFLPGGTVSNANGVSQDGSVVVGYSNGTAAVNDHAYRWTQGGGMVDLGTFAGGSSSNAQAVSADGSVVVGYSNGNGLGTNSHAYRWTQGGGMVDLGGLSGYTSTLGTAVSGDGNVVVGKGYNSFSDTLAFRWTQGTSIQTVAAWLSGAGVTVPVGLKLQTAAGTNSDGSVVVGESLDTNNHTEGYLARVGGSSGLGNGLLTNLDAFNSSIAQAAALSSHAGIDLPGMTLFGAHHRTLLDSGFTNTGNGCAWATADGGEQRADHTRTGLMEAGGCKDIGSVRAGLGVGQAWESQQWSSDGGAKYNGQYLVAEVDKMFGHKLEGSILGYYGYFNTQLSRHYINGAITDTSTGKPDAQSGAIRARLDWKDAAQAKGVSISPYVAYTWMGTKLDGYTENGGGFPAQFNSSTWNTNDMRIGASGKTALRSSTDLTLTLEGIHRFEKNTNDAEGQVVGLYNFDFQGQSLSANSIRAIVDVDQRVTEASVLSLSANATGGGNAGLGVSAGYKLSF